MSSHFVENIHIRLRDELERLGLSMADAARNMGEENSQGLRDVCAGRKRASAELIAKLTLLGADSDYILTGHRRETFETIADAHAPEHHRDPAPNTMGLLSIQEQELLNLYRRSKNEATKAAMRAAVQSLFDALEK